MTIETTYKALLEEITDRLDDDSLDLVTVRISPERDSIIIRVGDRTETIWPDIATSILYQISQLPAGCPAGALIDLMYF